MQTHRTKYYWFFLSLFLAILLLLLPASGGAAQGTNQEDPDDYLVSPGERFVTQEELEEIERDYTEFDEDNQGRAECGEFWVVLPGEYLGMITINCDIPLNELIRANPQIVNPRVIYPRQVITIPETPQFDNEIYDPDTGLPYVGTADFDDDGVGIPSTGNGAAVTDYDGSQQGRDECGETHSVDAGWALSTIIVNCDVPYGELVRVNPGVNFDQLRLGQEIQIPEGDFGEIFDPFTRRPYSFPATAGVGNGIPDTGGDGQGLPDTGGDYSQNELVFGPRGRLYIPDRDLETYREIASERDYTEYDTSEQGREECGPFWVILPGESLSTVAVNCDVPRADLLEENDWIADPRLVYSGEAILIPDGNFTEINDPFTGQPYTGDLLSTSIDTD